MSAQIPETMLLSDLLKSTGYDCPEDLQGRTFAEATAGGDVAAIIHGMYGNNKEALDMLATTLLTSPTPSSIKNIDMSLADIIHGNNMVNVTKHMFGCFGIDIANNKGE